MVHGSLGGGEKCVLPAAGSVKFAERNAAADDRNIGSGPACGRFSSAERRESNRKTGGTGRAGGASPRHPTSLPNGRGAIMMVFPGRSLVAPVPSTVTIVTTAPVLPFRQARSFMSSHAPAKSSSGGSIGGVRKFRDDLEVNKLFRALIKMGGSDLHLKVGKPPALRVRGTIREFDMPMLTDDDMTRLCYPMMDERNTQIFHDEGGADFAHVVLMENEQGVKEPWRFRVNLFIQMGKVGMVSRKVERSIPNFEGLYLPPTMESLCHYDQGMVLLAGVTGSGKSTTIASMLNYVNK